MAKLDIVDVYKILCEIVKDYPIQDKSYLQPHTFAVLKDPNQVYELDKKGIDYLEPENEGLFFSRAWDEIDNDLNKIPIDFPAVVVFSNRVSGTVGMQPYYEIGIYCCDLKERDNQEDKRAFEIIDRDIELILFTVLNKFKQYNYNGGWGTGSVGHDFIKNRIKTPSLSFDREYDDRRKKLYSIGTKFTIQGSHC